MTKKTQLYLWQIPLYLAAAFVAYLLVVTGGWKIVAFLLGITALIIIPAYYLARTETLQKEIKQEEALKESQRTQK